MITLLLTCALVLLLALGLWISQVKARELSSLSWHELVAQLEPVQTTGIRAVAVDHMNPTKRERALEPSELWDLMGREAGLCKMCANTEVLLALAAYAERWSPVESAAVAECMRRDALALRHSTRRVWWTMHLGIGRTTRAFYMHEAATAYYLMQQRLLALYETSYAGRHPALAAAL